MSTALISSSQSAGPEKLVTFRVAGQLFGLPATKVRDVLRAQTLMRVPLAKGYIAGAMNLRGHIVTAINLRAKLGCANAEKAGRQMCLVIEHRGELVSLLVDAIGDVMDFNGESVDANPGSLADSWKAVSDGIIRLQDELLVVLQTASLLDAA